MIPSTFLSFKSMVLVSTTVLSAAITLQYYSSATDFCEVASVFYNGVASWLKPPYLYLLINFIIITIVASSKFGNATTTKGDADMPPPPLQQQAISSPVIPNIGKPGLDGTVFNVVASEYGYNGVVSVEEENKTATFRVQDAMGNKENDLSHYVNLRDNESSLTKLNKKHSTEYPHVSVDAKPPARARFGHRRNVRTSPEGVKTVLGVSKPKRQDTLESTWKTITEGRAIPLTRHLKKSDTWERESRLSQDKTPQKTTMSKSETFNDRMNRSSPSSSVSSGGSGKIRREPSLGQDELNRRVEAFIKKFNEEMRLQRQESLNQYMEMVNRGSH